MLLVPKVAISLSVLLGTFAAGIYIDRTFLADSPLPLLAPDVGTQGSEYQFINSLLFCRDQNISPYANSLSNQIQKTVQDYVDASKATGLITDGSVYFRDLGNGPWVLVNGDLLSLPASLLKIPVAIGAYSQMEHEPSFASQRTKYEATEDANLTQYFKPLVSVENGKTYSNEELIRLMLQYSDNNALLLLEKNLNMTDVLKSFTDLGIETPKVATQYSMNVRTYSSFFRILYNASYLSKPHSELLLSVLSQPGFSQGLKAGVPKDWKVAHKFGEYEEPGGKKQLHDCGIIYRPKGPYLLCVMTHGTDFDKMTEVIRTISSRVHSILEAQD